MSAVSSAASVDISWVGYINMIDKRTRSDIQFLADRIMTLYHGWWTCGTHKEFLGKCHSLLSRLFLISFTRQASLYCKEYVYMYKYLTAWRLCVMFCCYHTIVRVKHFHTDWERCEMLTGYLSVGTSLAVTGWMHDTGQNIVKFSCQTRSSGSSSNYCT